MVSDETKQKEQKEHSEKTSRAWIQLNYGILEVKIHEPPARDEVHLFLPPHQVKCERCSGTSILPRGTPCEETEDNSAKRKKKCLVKHFYPATKNSPERITSFPITETQTAISLFDTSCKTDIPRRRRDPPGQTQEPDKLKKNTKKRTLCLVPLADHNFFPYKSSLYHFQYLNCCQILFSNATGLQGGLTCS